MKDELMQKLVESPQACEKILCALGLCARARKLTVGASLTITDCEKGKVKLAVLTRDVSDNTSEKLLRCFNKYSVPYIVLNSDSATLAAQLGKTGLVCAASICADGFDNIVYNALKNI